MVDTVVARVGLETIVECRVGVAKMRVEEGAKAETGRVNFNRLAADSPVVGREVVDELPES